MASDRIRINAYRRTSLMIPLTRRQLLRAGLALPSLAATSRIARAQSSDPNPLMIAEMRRRSYPGSAITIDRTLNPAATYTRYVSSYRSDGLKIYAYLTIPRGAKPATGWPVVVFNHGYIPPTQYRTLEKYIGYQDAFARNGYIVFRSDYRGHGSSEGEAAGGYGSPAYTVDVLNALSSIANHPDADPNRLAMWGHSMGGHITLRAMVVDKRIKAGVIWAGVVASYADMLERWRRRQAAQPTPDPNDAQSQRRRWRTELIEKYGDPAANPAFWNAISPISYVADASGPVSIHHGTRDTSVPIEFSQSLADMLKAKSKPHEYFIYQNDDHNLSRNLGLALRRSVAFFDATVKNAAV
jgi:dipeptidyl aminopeptidase/acylaminoacyl peptidase